MMSERVDKLREFVRMAGKATAVEQLALDLADEIAALKRENEALKGLLARYGKHDTDCKGVPLGITIECPCGLVPNVTHEVLKSRGGQILKNALLEEQA